MNKGVKLLLARVRSHPEEFIKSLDAYSMEKNSSRADWRWATNLIVNHPEKCPFIDASARDVFLGLFWEVQEKHFNERVISQLLHLDAD